MERRSEKREIDGVTFEVTALGGEQAMEALLKLGAVVGPALARAMSQTSDLDLVAAVNDLSKALKFSDVQWLSDVFGKATRYSLDGEKWPYLSKSERDNLFAGRLMTQFRWLKFCCEVNYPDFFESMKRGASAGARRASPPTAE